MPVQSPPPGFEVSKLSGPMIIGCFMHSCLFGTLTMQCYIYYEAFPKDKLWIKCLVYGTYILELVQTVLIAHDAFAIFGSGFGDVKALTDAHSFWFSIHVTNGLAAFIGQSFYAYRIHVLSKARTIPLLIMIISLTSCITAFVIAAFVLEAGNLALLDNRRTSEAIGVWCGGSVLADVLIAICMTYYLLQNDTGFRHTQALVSKLIRLTVETGTATAVAAITGLVLFFAFPSTTYYICIALLISKIYANVMLVVLNSRLRIVGGRATCSESDMVSFPSMVWRDDGASDGSTIAHSVVSITREEAFSDQNADDRVQAKTAVGESRSNV